MAEPTGPPLNLPFRDGAQYWPVQGTWTYEDYRQLPDDGQRYEVIRGHLYVSPAPTILHQRTVNRLSLVLNHFVLTHDLGEVLTAPVDILLPQGISNPVQPDLVFFRAGNQPPADASNFRGVPDLVVEVLSPTTRRLDTHVKLPACRDAGVPEVWHADPQARTLVLYGLSEDRKSYIELARGGEGDIVASRLLPGLEVEVPRIFPR
jgi:Uma2 family endonuclease